MVNIIIPTFKARDTLPNTLESLVNQTKKMFMVTIVQDADGEDYNDIIDTYEARGLKIRLLNTEVNGGPGVARQLGIDYSSMFDYLMFVDADDLLQPRAIELLYSTAKKTNADIVQSTIIREKTSSEAIYITPGTGALTWFHGKVYRRQYLIDNNIRFLDFRRNEDSYFNLVAFNCTENKANIEEPLYIWRNNSESLTHDTKVFFEKGCDDYCRGQIAGLEKIYSIVGEDIKSATIGMTLINIYKTMMEQMYKGFDILYYNDLLRLGKQQFIIDYFNEGDNWKWLTEKVPSSAVFDDEVVYFYKTRFIDFVNFYIFGKEKEVA